MPYTRHPGFSASPVFFPVMAMCAACWILSYAYSIGYPVDAEISATPLWEVICHLSPGKEWTYLMGMAFTAAGAFLLQRMNYVLMLIRENSRLPFLVYVLAISTNPDFFPLKSTSLGVFCLIFALYQLFSSYRDPNAREKAYLSALFIGLGSLLWVHLLWFLPLFWIGMFQLRCLSLRTFLASLLGVGTIYWFLFGLCFWTGDYTQFIVSFSHLFEVRFLAADGIVLRDWIHLFYMAFLTILAFLNIWANRWDNSLRSREYLTFLIAMSVWSSYLYFMYEQVSEEFMMAACVPASLLIAHFFSMKKGKMMKILFYLTLIILFGNFFNCIWNFL